MARHHHRTVIRRVHPTRQRVRLAVLWLLFLSALGLAFWAGYRQASTVMVPLNSEADVLRDQILALQTQAAVDRQTLDELREELATSRGSIDELERELAFYREVMAPEEVTRGIVLRQPQLRALGSPGRWSYRFVAQQGGRDRSVHKGDLYVTLWGNAAGTPMGFNLSELDEELSADALGLSFRYFQRFEGELTLPPGFEPERIELRAVISKPKDDALEASYAWAEVAITEQAERVPLIPDDTE